MALPRHASVMAGYVSTLFTRGRARSGHSHHQSKVDSDQPCCPRYPGFILIGWTGAKSKSELHDLSTWASAREFTRCCVSLDRERVELAVVRFALCARRDEPGDLSWQ